MYEENANLLGNDASREEENQFLYTNEGSILDSLLKAADYANDEDEIYPIEIVRNEKVIFRFRIHPLSDAIYNQNYKTASSYQKNKRLGTRVQEDFDLAKYRNLQIYAATIPEDQEAIWNNRAAWKALDCINGPELIGKVLLAGEKDMLINRIDEISGYSDETIPTEDLVKN